VKIALIEFNDFHEEVLFSQLDFLAGSDIEEIHLLTNKKLVEKGLKPGKDVIFAPFEFNSYFDRIKALIKVFFYIHKNKIDVVVFNSLENIYVKLILKILRKRKIFCIAHNLDRFVEYKESNAAYFVLNKTLLSYIKNNYRVEANYFYPLIKTPERKRHQSRENIRIVIPGLVELSRRDYLGWLEAIKNPPKNIEFVLLGNIRKNDGPLVLSGIRKYKLEKIVRYYETFVPYKEYFDVLQSADLILPLIHPNVENFYNYHFSKITAAFTMAFSFKVPLLLYKSLHEMEEFQDFSIGYESLLNVLGSLDKQKIEILKQRMDNAQEISYEYQKERYKRLISG